MLCFKQSVHIGIAVGVLHITHVLLEEYKVVNDDHSDEFIT